MLSQKTLELKGSFLNFPLAEVMAELAQERLSGSLRVSCDEKKSVVYFDEGTVAHAVSNARDLRLFTLLLGQNKVDHKLLASQPDFTDDLKLSAGLLRSGVLTDKQLSEFIEEQVRAVIAEALSWREGQWLFSPLARLRADMRRRVNVASPMIDHARDLSASEAVKRFKSVQEVFERANAPSDVPSLHPREAFLLSRFNGKRMKFEEVRAASGLGDAEAAHVLYALWLGGLVTRTGWNGAFSPSRLNDIRNARLSLICSAQEKGLPLTQPFEPPQTTIRDSEPAATPEVELSLPDYLDRVEKAATHYEVLGVSAGTKTAEIKQAYFSMAKLFHPDRYHREESNVLRRIQNAFTEIAHAYDVLKSEQSRASYDLKLKKEQESKRKAGAKGKVVTDASAAGLESFEQGVEFLDDGDIETAIKCFARAVHYAPNHATYHAYFGKALAADEKMKHKAESELQTAVKLAPKDPKVRLMLVDFLIKMDMTKRAEGELNRFLEIAPDHPEALRMLQRLKK